MNIGVFFKNSFEVFKKQPVLVKLAFLYPLAFLLPAIMSIVAMLVMNQDAGIAVTSIALIFMVFSPFLVLGMLLFLLPALSACSINGSRIAQTDERKLTLKELYQASSGYIGRLLGVMVLQTLMAMPIILLNRLLTSGFSGITDAALRSLVVSLVLLPLNLLLVLLVAYWNLAIVLENLKIGKAFKRAWSFITQNFGKALAIDALLYLIIFIPGQLIALFQRPSPANTATNTVVEQMNAIPRLFEGFLAILGIVLLLYIIFVVFMLVTTYKDATRVQFFLAVNPAPQVEVAIEAPAAPSDDAQPQV